MAESTRRRPLEEFGVLSGRRAADADPPAAAASSSPSPGLMGCFGARIETASTGSSSGGNSVPGPVLGTSVDRRLPRRHPSLAEREEAATGGLRPGGSLAPLVPGTGLEAAAGAAGERCGAWLFCESF